MKVLVLGGSGFIGSHVVDRLLTQGHTVRVFDRAPERFRPALPDVDYRFGDFADRATLAEALAGIEAVVHLISTSFPGTADRDPASDVQGNLIGALTLLDLMVSLDVRRIVFLSSGGTVYGIPEIIPIPESHPLRPISSHGIVKVAIEHYLGMYGRMRGLSTLAVRASNPFGPRQGHTGVQGVISTFLRRILMDEPIEIWGDGSVVRDYLHVVDLARLCGRAVETDHTGAVNAGTGIGISISGVVEEIEDVTGVRLEPVYRPGRALDVPCSILDTSRAREDFGWEPTIAFRQGLAETWDWMRTTQ